MTSATQGTDATKAAAVHRIQAARHRAAAAASMAEAEEEESLALQVEIDGGLRDRSTVTSYSSDLDGALRYRERS